MEERRLLKTLPLILVLILIGDVASEQCFDIKNETFVKTKDGWLEGKIVENLGVTYHSYKGIPYAEPPIGKLRFQAPVPKSKWNGIRPALEHGNFCANRAGYIGTNNSAGGSEDCLFLNVYTPSLQGNRSVLFFIHGGSFTSGNGETSNYGPEHLLKEDVVVVTLNYRLSAFGFLSTNDENAPGNAGLKDIVLALKWVKRNIRKFGGNPEDVTASGHSAGSAAVHYLIISDLKEELFQKAILQSGSSLMPGLFQPNPKAQAEKLASRLNIEFTNSADLIKKLQAVDFQDIINVEESTFNMEQPFGLRPIEFAPCIEPENTEGAILTENPLKRMIDGNFKKVPLLLGSTSFEGMLAAIYFFQINPNGVEYFNSQPSFLVPLSFELTEGSENFNLAVNELRSIYFNDQIPDIFEWLAVYSDFGFTAPLDRVARFSAAIEHPPIYYYQFSFNGSLNYFKNLLPGFQSFPGACHADELNYLYEPENPVFVPDERSTLIRNRMTKMWTNFAKYGNPTPQETSLLPETWKPFTLSEESYFNIDETLENRQIFPRMNIVSYLQGKYTGHF